MPKVKDQKLNKGFTLIETMTALLIFSASIVTLIVATRQGFVDTGYAKNKFIASYLAQEGVERVRNSRDSFGWSESEMQAEAGNASQSLADFPGFTRNVSVIVSGDEARITSAVVWQQGQSSKEVEYIEYLFNWQQ